MILRNLKLAVFIVLSVYSFKYVCGENMDEGQVTVVRMKMNYERKYTLPLNTSYEFIVEFTPNPEQALWPTRVFLQSEGSDTLRPVLVTARQITGAVTWQLPWLPVTGKALHKMERTMCPASHIYDGQISDCVGEDEKTRGVIVHISSTCAVPVSLSLLVTPVRDWNLPFGSETLAFATQESPRTFLYTFLEDQQQVRLILSSEDNVCALISIQNYTCPLLEDELSVQQTGQRMTMMRSAGVQLSRRNYPVGFYVVVVVRSSDESCTGEGPAADEDWLWEEIFWGEPDHLARVVTREKTVTIQIQPALSRSQYVIASVVTVVVFLGFYLLCLAFILAQKYKPFLRVVQPMDPPIDNTDTEEATRTQAVDVSDNTPALRRRASTDTLDDSDNSNTDSDDETPPAKKTVNTVRIVEGNQSSPPQANGEQVGTVSATVDNGTTVTQPQQTTDQSETPFGLPARLRLAALSQRRARTLRARSDRYLWTLVTVAVFYALPVVQFVAAFQFLLNVSGSLDICYYNWLCAHPAGQVSDFNHVFSNLGYLMLGALFILQVYRRKRRRQIHPRNEEYGIPPHYGLLHALGAGLMVVALLSASYHICPNRLNFQFDTAFMYVLAVVMMVKIYQSRHPDVNARAHATFGVLALMIALGVWGVLGGGALFWAVFTVLHLVTFLMLSLRIYYVGQFRLEKETLQRAARGLAAFPKHGVQPLYRTRLLMLALANCLNWAIALFGLWTQSSDFASHLLTVLLGNTLLYMSFYLVMKLLHGERPRWYAWCFLAAALITWGPALYFFLAGSSSWSSTPAESRHRNHECHVLEFYDNHDLWHFLSAIALYLTFNVLLTWDDGLMAVKRTEIAVF